MTNPWKKTQPKKSKGLEGTPEQTAIWEAIASQPNEVVINALAGVGKTTTCVASMNQLAAVARITRKRIAFCAFTSSVADELKKKVPYGMTAGTLHSIMFGVLRESFPQIRIEIKKTRQLQDILFKGEHWSVGERWALILLVSLCKNEGVDPPTINDPGLFLTFVFRLNARHSFWSESRGPGNLVSRSRRILEVCADLEKVAEHGIDYDDMLWLPYYHGLQPNTFYDLLFIDECQDINFVQQVNSLSIAKRVVAVGDRNQSIYGFRGADVNAISNLTKMLEPRYSKPPLELPLTICWRCPLEGIALAQQLVPDIQPSPNAIPGEVDIISKERILKNAQPGDLILCRTNAPLVKAAYQLWKESRPAHIIGRKIGQGLITLAEQIEHEGSCKTMPEFDLAAYQREESDLRRILQLPDSEAQANDIRERFECLRAVTENVRTIAQMKEDLATIFSDDDDTKRIRLSSVHRAKGLEADNVSILEPHLMPHPRATQPWEEQQERNCCYIAVTRFKKRLQFAGQLPRLLH